VTILSMGPDKAANSIRKALSPERLGIPQLTLAAKVDISGPA
jgi:electron transfer flavoprotein alpha/beta subunit